MSSGVRGGSRPTRWSIVGTVVGALLVGTGLTHPPSPSPACAGLECGPAPLAIELANGWNVTANGSVNATGGCAGPGTGAIEYCIELNIVQADGQTTVGLGLTLRGPGGVTTTFVNVTLYETSSDILATYTTEAGWAAGAATLPVLLSSSETLIVNVGRVPPTGDTFTAASPGGGTCTVGIP